MEAPTHTTPRPTMGLNAGDGLGRGEIAERKGSPPTPPLTQATRTCPGGHRTAPCGPAPLPQAFPR